MVAEAYAPSMVDVIVRATATRWAADEFPGWVEASVLDARGKKHRIVEKVPVLTSLRVTAESPFPFEFWIAAEVDGRGGGPRGPGSAHGPGLVPGQRARLGAQ
jgi:hypothetical protein